MHFIIFAKDDRSAPVYTTSNVVLMFENQRFSFGLIGLQIQVVSLVLFLNYDV